MNKQFNMTIDLSPDEIKEAIADYVSRNFSGLLIENEVMISEQDVTINVGTNYADRGEVDHPILKGASVKVKKMGSYQDR